MSERATQAGHGELVPWAASFITGLGVCLGLSLTSGGREAVDTAAYFPVGVPLMAVAIFALGYRFPERPWRWTLSMIAGQMTAMLLTGSSLSMWPIALVFMLVCSTPQFVAGHAGSRLAKRGAGKRPDGAFL